MNNNPVEDLVGESATDATGEEAVDEGAVDERAVDDELAAAGGEGGTDAVVGIGGEEAVGADAERVRDGDNAGRGRW